MQDAVSEIKARLSIEDLVRQYVQLKKTGRSLKGLCPFHAEKTPSFVVSPERGIAYCFGCHKGGDIFKFIQEVEGLEFIDALKVLAERTGIQLSEHRFEKSLPKSEKDRLFEIHELATRFYEKQLFETKDGEKVLAYLHQRGLKDETIRFFRLGFAPDSFEQTFALLLKEGFSKKELVISGLAQAKETTGDKIYDRFRGRLMFPILDGSSRIVGFGGRALKHDQEPKYLNSPETPIYRKSMVLYGFDKSKNTIKQRKEAIVVEGYMDMIASFQAGVQHVVATSGTALTEQQLRLLKPFVENLFLAFDMDHAGQEAAQRAFHLTLPFDFEVKVLTLPQGKDIAEYVQQPQADLAKMISAALPFGHYLIRYLTDIYGTDSIPAKRKILQEFFPFLSQLKSTLHKDEYIRLLAHDLALEERQIYDEIKNFKLPIGHPARTFRSLDSQTAEITQRVVAEELFVGFMIEFPRIALLLKDKIQEEFFSEPLKAIYKAFFDQYNTQGAVERAQFLASLPYELAEKATLLSLYVNEMYGEISEEGSEAELKALLLKISKKFFSEKAKKLQQNLMEAERNGEKELSRKLLQELHTLNIQVLG